MIAILAGPAMVKAEEIEREEVPADWDDDHCRAEYNSGLQKAIMILKKGNQTLDK